MRLLIAVLLFSLAALTMTAAAADGQASYTKACKMCHGPNGEGNPAIAKALKVTLPDLKSKEVQSKTDEALKTVLLKGQGKMKPITTISEGEFPAVIEYLRVLAKK